MSSNLKIWPQSLSYRKQEPAERPPRDFMIPVFISVVIHAFLAFQIWIAVTERTPVKPASPANDTPLILSLSTFTADSHDGMDHEEAPEVPRTDSPEPSSGNEFKPEDDVVISENQDVSISEPAEEKYSAPADTPSFDMEAAKRMELDFGIMSELESEFAMISEGRGIPGSGSSEGKSLLPCAESLTSQELYLCIEQEFGGMSDTEIMETRIKSRMLSIMNFIAENSDPSRNCKTAYSGRGLLAIPSLIKDAITGNGCKWGPVLKMDEPPVYIIDGQTADPFKNLLPFEVKDNRIIFNISKEGEIRVKGKKVNLNAIKGLMEIYRNEYPDGSVIITCDNDSLYETALEMRDQIREAKVNMTVIVDLEKTIK